MRHKIGPAAHNILVSDLADAGPLISFVSQVMCTDVSLRWSLQGWMFVNTTCPDFQQQYRLKFLQSLRNYSCRPSGYHISKVQTYTAVQNSGGPDELEFLLPERLSLADFTAIIGCLKCRGPSLQPS